MANKNSNHQLTEGIYQLFNIASGTVIDVSLQDRKNVKGHPAHGMLNQQWEVKPLGSGYSICNVLNGHYLTVEYGANDGAHIIATPYPVSWSLEPLYAERESWVISWPNAAFVFDLNRGSNKPGEAIQLRPRRPAEFCQRWRFVPYQTLPNNTTESKDTPTPYPASTTGVTSNTTDLGVKNSVSSSTSSTVNTIVDSSEWSPTGDGDMIITTITTTVTRLSTKRLTEPESGKTYNITNVEDKTVIDLNGSDDTPIVAHKAHGGSNQKWLFEYTGKHWTLKSPWDGRYIGVDDRPEVGTCLIATHRPVEWDVRPDEEDKGAYRISVPDEKINFDLSNFDSPNLGVPVVLRKRSQDKRQTWRFQEV